MLSWRIDAAHLDTRLLSWRLFLSKTLIIDLAITITLHHSTLKMITFRMCKMDPIQNHLSCCMNWLQFFWDYVSDLTTTTKHVTVTKKCFTTCNSKLYWQCVASGQCGKRDTHCTTAAVAMWATTTTDQARHSIDANESRLLEFSTNPVIPAMFWG